MKYRFLSSLDKTCWTYVPKRSQKLGGCAPSLGTSPAPLGICGLNCYLKSCPQHSAEACRVSDEERADLSYTVMTKRPEWTFKKFIVLC